MSRLLALRPARAATAALSAALAAAAVAAAPAGALVASGSTGWSWSSPQPVGHDLTAVAFAPSRGYAVGTLGTFLRTDDGGATWTGLPTGTTDALRFVQALGNDTAIAAGGCEALRTDDGGATVHALRLPGSVSASVCLAPAIAGLSFVSGNVGYVVLQDGTLLRTDDGGATFARRTSVPLGGGPAGGIAFADASTGLAIGGAAQGAIVRTTDGGGSWTTVLAAGTGLNAIRWLDPAHVVAVGNGLMALSADAGRTWTTQPITVAGVSPNLTDASCTAPDACVMTTADGRALVRLDGAQVSAVAPASRPVHGIARTAAGRVVAVGDAGTVTVSDDAGRTFATTGSTLPVGLTGLRAGPSGAMLALGTGGVYHVTADAGRTWISGGIPSAAPVADASFPTTRTGYVLTADGGLLRTGNSGASWSVLDPGTALRSTAVYAPSEATVVLTSPRGLRRSFDGGATFRPVSGAGLARSMARIAPAGRAIVAGGPSVLAMSTDGARTWRTLPRPSRTALTAGSWATSRIGWVTDAGGRVWRTGDRGRTWATLVGTGPWRPVAVAAVSATEAFVAVSSFGSSLGGWVLHTTDGGRSWTPQAVAAGSPALGVRGLAVSGRAAYALTNDNSVLVAPSGGDGTGTRSTLSLKASATRLRRPGVVRITGRLSPARGGESIAVSLRIAGRGTWRRLTVNAASDGRFTVTRRYSATTDVVAQWAGDTTRTGDGTAPLRIRVG